MKIFLLFLLISNVLSEVCVYSGSEKKCKGIVYTFDKISFSSNSILCNPTWLWSYYYETTKCPDYSFIICKKIFNLQLDCKYDSKTLSYVSLKLNNDNHKDKDKFNYEFNYEFDLELCSANILLNINDLSFVIILFLFISSIFLFIVLIDFYDDYCKFEKIKQIDLSRYFQFNYSIIDIDNKMKKKNKHCIILIIIYYLLINLCIDSSIFSDNINITIFLFVLSWFIFLIILHNFAYLKEYHDIKIKILKVF